VLTLVEWLLHLDQDCCTETSHVQLNISNVSESGLVKSDLSIHIYIYMSLYLKWLIDKSLVLSGATCND